MHSYVCIVQRRCNLDVRLVRFRAHACEFLSEVMQCCVTCNCGVFILMYVRLNVSANAKMGAVIVGYGIAVNSRLSFTNDIFVFFDVTYLVLTFDESL